MTYFRDGEFRERMLALMSRSRPFLRRVAGLLGPADFTPLEAEKGQPEPWAREQVARMVMAYYREFRQPIGGFLRTEALDLIRQEKQRLGKRQRVALMDLVERLKDPELAVAEDSVTKKIIAYKERENIRRGIDRMLQLQQKGELNAGTFQRESQRVLQKVSGRVQITDYGAGLEERISRREREKSEKYPYLFIDPIDEKVRSIPRGQLGLILAKYKVGKSVLMAHLAQAYALQGYAACLFTLEDPLSAVEDRLDASLCGLELLSLPRKQNTLRRLFQTAWENMRSNIYLVDATGGGWSVARMQETVDTLRNRGKQVDAVLIDYDEQIEPATKYKGDPSAIRLQSQETYLDLTRWAARDQVFMWTAAQATIPKIDKMVITGEDAAEDKSKLRKVGMCIGVGQGPKELPYDGNCRYAYIAAHKFGRMKIGWPIVGDYEKGIFYDRDLTREALAKWKKINGQPE